jgi:hypothetical protein
MPLRSRQEPLSLGVAFIGFDDAAQLQLSQWIEPLFGGRRGWSEASVEEADALCIHADAVASVDGPTLTLRSRFGGPATVRTDRLLRPVGVGGELREDVSACATFDANSQYSVINLFRMFEARLAPLRQEYAMGETLALRQDLLGTGNVYHLMHEGRLIAIADTIQRVFGARQPIHANVLHAADWRRRPEGAAAFPPEFIARSFADLLWTYASRSSRQVLPIDLRTGRIGLSKLPQVPMDRLNAIHVKIMSSIQRDRMTLDELVERIGGSREAIGRAVGALYWAGALSLATLPPLVPPAGRFESFRRLLQRDSGAMFFARLA